MRDKIINKIKRKRILNEKECEYDLKDIIPLLFVAFSEATEKYKKQIGMTLPDARLRGFEAQTLNANIVEAIQRHFSNYWRIGKYGRFMLYIKGYIILFKKLDHRGLPMNIPTKMSDTIGNQLQGKLFKDNEEEDGSAPILFFGYKKNKFGIIESPELVYIDEGKRKWCIRAHTDEKSLMPDLFSTPTEESTLSSEIERPKAIWKGNKETDRIRKTGTDK